MTSEPIFSPARAFTATDAERFQQLAAAAKCIDDDDYGTDRQIDAENAFYREVTDAFGFGNPGFADELADFITATKMATDEHIDWTMSMVRDAIHNISPEAARGDD
jgi:hypothetical protein